MTPKEALNRVPRLWKARFARLGALAGKRGRALCLVGGCVRDLLLGRQPLDWDMVAEGPATDLARNAAALFKARLVVHSAFLTSTLHFTDGTSLDVATARTESYAEPGSLPVVEPGSLEDDFKRRDFTINAMAIHVTPRRWGLLEDPRNGRGDLKKKWICALHPRSFEDDPTRIFRAARYAGRYGFMVEPKTRRWIRKALQKDVPAVLSAARLRAELERLLGEENPRPALGLLWKWGASSFWSSQWGWNRFVRQALAGTTKQAPEARVGYGLMVLCRFMTVEETRRDLEKLEFPRATVDAVCRTLGILRAIEAKRLEAAPETLSPEKRAFLSRALGEPGLVRRWEQSAPRLTGEDFKRLGYVPGPVFGQIQKFLREQRWAGRVRSRADELNAVVANFPLNN